MKALKLSVVVILSFLVPSQSALAQDRAAFERALLLEEAQARFEEAISAYEQVIDKTANPALAAQAQLHIGICYEKLGLQQARLAYQKVIDNYPTQIAAVAVAKEKLSVLKLAKKPVRTDKRGFQLRRVWAEPYDTLGMPSPDGRYMSYVNWRVPCLGIYEFATGKSRDITSTKGTWDGDQVWAESSIWSPDGKKLAYVWYGKDHVSLRIVGIDSSKPVEIFGDTNHPYCHPCSWSKDGHHILAVLCRKDRVHEIALISLDDHSVRILKELEPGYHPWTALSPDGKYVAYSFPPDMSSPTTDIYLLSTADGTVRTLVDHPATDYSPLWMPDGQNIIFFSDRTGTVSVWSQKISEGRADGEEKLVKNLNRLLPKTVLQNGDLYLLLLEGGSDVYSVDLDPEAGQLVSAPRRIVETNVGWNGSACYSADGKTMAYVSERGVLGTLFAWGQQHLILRALETGEERELIPRSRELSGGGIPLRWSPDSDEILFKGRDQSGSNGAYILNLHDNTLESMTPNKDFIGARVVWGHTSQKLYFVLRGISEKNGIYEVDRKTHRQTRLVSEPNLYELALRPGHDEIAVVAGKAIKLLNLENRELRDLLDLGTDVRHAYIEWSPDGRWLYFAKCLGQKTVEMWRTTADGQHVQLVEKSFPHVRSFSIHPDGKKLVFAAGKGGGAASVWVMRNFLD